MPELRIVERQAGRVVLLDFHGRIRIGQGDSVLREAVSRLADSGKVNIVFNLADVPLIDSSVVGELGQEPEDGEPQGRQDEAAESSPEDQEPAFRGPAAHRIRGLRVGG
jgi:anti-anti-sigma regulatory factor